MLYIGIRRNSLSVAVHSQCKVSKEQQLNLSYDLVLQWFGRLQAESVPSNRK